MQSAPETKYSHRICLSNILGKRPFGRYWRGRIALIWILGKEVMRVDGTDSLDTGTINWAII
jgi:hypothetical protein